ncbi:hypothetical protein [Dyadobacter sp. NIV53]|uniref:hypothetical protein n=1 Tax=Dyadobacter sp. NIV53 TaxID=2861765 RepID=UPI001C869F2B|nr:hypothetical protein [Dyadobacter sp. NIV53]
MGTLNLFNIPDWQKIRINFQAIQTEIGSRSDNGVIPMLFVRTRSMFYPLTLLAGSVINRLIMIFGASK